MQIIVAYTAGFCFGVKRAVDQAYEAVKNSNKPIYTLGPLIHNPQVVEDLNQKGVKVIHNLKELADDNSVVIIRTHGVPKSDYEYLEQRGIDFIDLTCPYVKKIHNIVHKAYKAGQGIIIVGDKNHPEVIGINGWCGGEAIVIDSAEQANELDPARPYCLVAQTTINQGLYNEILLKLKEMPLIIEEHHTICDATSKRQNEAIEIAKKVDLMIVIGGLQSSNTRKLKSVSEEFCKNTIQIEGYEHLNDVYIKNKVGITAGASTPAHIIKEVIEKMTEQEKNAEGNINFMDEVDKTFKTLNTGDLVTGTVIGITPTEVYVNLGTKADGFIPVGELTDDPALKASDIVNVGDEIEVFVVRVNDVEGTIMLSKKKVDSIKGWNELEESFEKGEILKGTVIDVVKGGMIMLVNSVRVFIPASQAYERYLSDLSVLKNKELPLKLIDMNPNRKKIVGSVRQVLSAERKEKEEAFWNDVEVGKHYQGVVKSLTSFGAFVDVGGVDGLVHISELSWGRIKHPSEVCKVGDVMDVYIKDFDKESKKVSLGYKNPADDPWEKAKNLLNLDDVIKCKVVRLVSFGAFVEIFPNVDGLIHISQIANKRIEKPSDELKIGQEVEAKIIALDFEQKKISLSIRALLSSDDIMRDEETLAQVAQEQEETVEEPETAAPPAEETVPVADESVEVSAASDDEEKAEE